MVRGQYGENVSYAREPSDPPATTELAFLFNFLVKTSNLTVAETLNMEVTVTVLYQLLEQQK